MKVPPVKIQFSDEDIAEFQEESAKIIKSGHLTLGRQTELFEDQFANKESPTGFDGALAIAVNSGTAALEILLRCVTHHVDKSAYGYVVIPNNTFAATAFAVLKAGFMPVLCDGDFGLDTDFLQNLLRSPAGHKIAAVVVMHTGGEMEPSLGRVVDMCRKKNVAIIEDAAHAHGSTVPFPPHHHPGQITDGAAYSFYPTKVITSGEGGMIVTRDAEVAKLAALYRDQGKRSFLENTHGLVGYNWRMPELSALLGRIHHRSLAAEVEGRRDAAVRYIDVLEAKGGAAGDMGYRPMRVSKFEHMRTSNYYKYIWYPMDGAPARGGLRKEVKAYCRGYEVYLPGEVYDTPLSQQPFFRTAEGRWPGPPWELEKSEKFCKSHICVPIWNGITDEEIEYVVDTLQGAYKYVTKE